MLTFCIDLHVLIVLSVDTYISGSNGWICLLHFIFNYILCLYFDSLSDLIFMDQFNPIYFLISSKLVGQLDDCGSDAVRISDCFIRNSLGFTIYSDYCTNYPRFVYISMITFHFQTKHSSSLSGAPRWNSKLVLNEFLVKRDFGET